MLGPGARGAEASGASGVRTHLGHQLGSGTGRSLLFPSPELGGLCGAWNSAVLRTCGPGEPEGWCG